MKRLYAPPPTDAHEAPLGWRTLVSRQWARRHYQRGTPILPSWHPDAIRECQTMNTETQPPSPSEAALVLVA